MCSIAAQAQAPDTHRRILLYLHDSHAVNPKVNHWSLWFGHFTTRQLQPLRIEPSKWVTSWTCTTRHSIPCSTMTNYEKTSVYCVICVLIKVRVRISLNNPMIFTARTLQWDKQLRRWSKVETNNAERVINIHVSFHFHTVRDYSSNLRILVHDSE